MATEYGVVNSNAESDPDAPTVELPRGLRFFPFTALHTAVLDTVDISIYRPSGLPGYTSVSLGIFDDDAGSPGALIESHALTGPFTSPAFFALFTATVTEGETYWLAIKTAGGSNPVHVFVRETGGAIAESAGSITDSPAVVSATYTDGPLDHVTIYGYYEVADPAPPPAPRGLVFQVAGLWDVDADTVPFYGQVANPIDAATETPLNDSRTASVTFSLNDPIVARLSNLVQITYAITLKAYYDGVLECWGIVHNIAVDFDAGTIRLDAMDPSLRLKRHYLRRGDLVGAGAIELAAINGDQGWVTAAHDGILRLLEAGDTTAFPPLGIADGDDLSDYVAAPYLVQVGRGDNLWDKIQETRVVAKVDIDLEPVDDTPGVYCQMNLAQPQGDDLTPLALHYGCGVSNLENVTLTEGEQYTNLVHVTDSDGKLSSSPADPTALARTGPYIDWESGGYGAADDSSDTDVRAALQTTGEDILRNQGRPTKALTLTMPVDGPGGLRYRRDYKVGDRIPVAARSGGFALEEALYRIVQVSLRPDGDLVRPELTVVPVIDGVEYTDGDGV